jgi:hypothetical protein
MKKIAIIVDDLIAINNFYPEDLPLDWYVDYYLNEFEALYITLSQLDKMGIDEDELLDTLNERDELCQLFLEDSDINIQIFDSVNIEPHLLSSITKQGVDATELILIDLSSFVDLKALNTFLQNNISHAKNKKSILKISTPVDNKQLNDLQILIDLTF